MIKTQGGNPGDYRLGHNICAVVRASDTNLENGGINLSDVSTNVRS